MLNLVLVGLFGYLAGSFPTGYLIGKSRGVDVRKYGSGGTGGTNVQRTLGTGAAVLTGVTDILKGTLAVWVGAHFAGDWGYFLGGMFAVLGHSYPVWLGFRGGKSVATGAGAVLLAHPMAVLAGLVAFIGAVIPTRWVSLGSLVAALVLNLMLWAEMTPLPHKLLGFCATVLIFIRHWENIKRILAGTENRFGEKAKPRLDEQP